MELNSQSIFNNNDLLSYNRSLILKAKCTQNHQSILACNNNNCHQYAFVCSDRNCQCRVNHKKCLFTCTDQILQIIQQKRSQSTTVIDKICIVLQKWIDQISRTRQKIEQTVLDWGLSGAQKKFIQLIKNQEYKKLTGHHINQITTQTISYFSQEVKEKLFIQIDQVQKNYDAQIKLIMKQVQSLFERYQLQQKDIGFKEEKDIKLEFQFNFISEFQTFRNQELKLNQKKPEKQDYQKFINFMKSSLKKDFQHHFGKFKTKRRAYGNKKLRQKYFDDYLYVLMQGKQYMSKWQSVTQNQMKYFNKNSAGDIEKLSKFFHQSDGQIQKPFTTQMALSLQRTINAIELVIDHVRKQGKNMLHMLQQKNKMLQDTFELAIYFLDQVMDDHPQIDEVDVIWNTIRFQGKLTNEIKLLCDVIDQAKDKMYKYELP